MLSYGFNTASSSSEAFTSLTLTLASLLALLGFADDAFGLPVKLRLLVQFAVACLGSYFFLGVSSTSEMVWIYFIFYAVLAVWSVNLFNFMDGMDGLAATEATFVFAGTAVLVYLRTGLSPLLPYLLIGTILGFLCFNRPRASVFMGDVGSLYLGFLVFFLPLLYFARYEISFWFLVIIYAAFWGDATLTLLRRILNGERWHDPHRKHLYQRLHHIAGWSHSRVLRALIVINALLLSLACLGLLGVLSIGQSVFCALTLIASCQLLGDKLAPFETIRPKRARKVSLFLINEYNLGGSPVAKLVYDLQTYFSEKTQTKSFVLYVSKKYVPGGLSLRRIFNLLAINLILPLFLGLARLRSLILGEALVVVATTNPPLIQWAAALWSAVMRCPCVVWYQDAHPDYEISFFEKRGWERPVKILRYLDKFFLGLCDGFITLDVSMGSRLRAKLSRPLPMLIAPPWTTYCHPPIPLSDRVRLGQPLRLLYAGNYGAAHDLSPLAQAIRSGGYFRNRTLEISFVGMSQLSQKRLKAQFEGVKANLKFFDRFAHLDQLLMFFREFDFGIVSLANSHSGLSCPSKAYTYLSQGWPYFMLVLTKASPHNWSELDGVFS